ncbi:alpha/beta hydrolase [Stigmatella aurantiaca]|uniref:Carboxylesterase n=1 Tax=Stigmatella aurantiaca (strain DW4/3-1) TaxID=378806 RepID=Q09CE3_STIAD|nr:phospholipase [Stigmatella aurantiaca]ADO69593.1 Phospholipase/carboxylesterase family protein [Stigmatella aurantiaca DW4/3-1]EAU69425.1 carboxylesterase [Stigmatella aurantiaca DW4/3-1]
MAMRRISTRLGELDCQVVDALPDGAPPELAVILCHGFGAPATDLVPLAPELMNLRPELAQHVRFVFPGAPLTLASMGMPGARAWFHLPQEVLMGQQRNWDEYSLAVPEGLPAARRAVMGVVSALSAATKLPYGRIVLGGFSQGSMVTTDVTLRLEEAPAGLCILSGAPIAQTEWKARAANRKGLPVFQGHGRSDAVLPFQGAERLRDLLTQAGLAVEFLPFDGPHTIAPEELEKLADFLVARLPAR